MTTREKAEKMAESLVTQYRADEHSRIWGTKTELRPPFQSDAHLIKSIADAIEEAVAEQQAEIDRLKAELERVKKELSLKEIVRQHLENRVHKAEADRDTARQQLKDACSLIEEALLPQCDCGNPDCETDVWRKAAKALLERQKGKSI